MEDVNKLIKSLNRKKATGPGTIPPKLIKLAADVIDQDLTNIINQDVARNAFSESAKMAHVSTTFKKLERTSKENCRPVSILNTFSKVSEKYIKEQLSSCVDKCVSVFVSAYKMKYSAGHVIFRLIENWKKILIIRNLLVQY